LDAQEIKRARRAVKEMNDPDTYDPVVGHGHNPEILMSALDRLEELETKEAQIPHVPFAESDRKLAWKYVEVVLGYAPQGRGVLRCIGGEMDELRAQAEKYRSSGLH